MRIPKELLKQNKGQSLSLFSKNLELLKTSQPSLARKVEREPKQASVKVLLAKDGCLIPQIGLISLHSNYYPLKESHS